MAKKPDINLSSQDLADAKERLKTRQLIDDDFDLLIINTCESMPT